MKMKSSLFILSLVASASASAATVISRPPKLTPEFEELCDDAGGSTVNTEKDLYCLCKDGRRFHRDDLEKGSSCKKSDAQSSLSLKSIN